MFTGIVQAVGRIASAQPTADGLRLSVETGVLDASDLHVGDSIAVSGCCLTVVAADRGTLAFDVSAETLRCTTRLDRRGEVNLEKALQLSGRLGGHLVAGHVDGVGSVTRFARATGDGANVELEIEAPPELARFIASKGSIAIDGVSLTVNAVAGRRFAVNLIPHTLAVTTLGSLAASARVNLEVDMVARYLARLHDLG